MDFNEKGFLGTAIVEFSKSVEEHYAAFFEACSRINELAHAVKFELEVHNKDGQEVLAATLFLRLLNGFQATVILSRLGLVTEAKIVLRSALESLFILRLLCKDEKFLAEYVGSDEVRRLKWMNVASQSKSPLFNELRSYATPSVRQELEEKIKRNNWKELKPNDVAHRAGLLEMYEADYRLLSEEVHTLPRSMQYLLKADEAGDVSMFDWGPSAEGIEYVLVTAIRSLFIGLVAVTELFKVNKTEDLAIVDRTLTTLAGELKA